MRKLIRIIAVILLIVGIGFFAYPIALRVVFNMQANQAIDQLERLKQTNFRMMRPSVCPTAQGDVRL